MKGLLEDQSMPFVVTSPITVPQVKLLANTGGLPICQFQLTEGQTFNITYLVLHFVGFRTLGFLGKINTGLPLVYAGVYYQSTLTKNNASARPIWHLGVEFPSAAGGMQSNVEFSQPGIYQVLLVNNAASSAISALVTGTAQVFNV